MKRLLLLIPLLHVVCGQTLLHAQSLEDKIRRVENGLLPSVLIDGDSVTPYSLTDRLRFHKVPGLSLAVIHDGRIEWAKGYGLASQKDNRPVDVSTMFQAASLSKPVSALAALHWVEQGRLALDTDINTYLKPTWRVPENRFTTTQKVTLRRLLTHTAGLTVHGFRGYAAKEPVPDVVAVLNGKAPANSKAIVPDTIPGAIWRYSGGGYTVMQKALEDQLGLPFAEIMQKTVLDPLRMEHSTYAQPLPERFRGRAATGYRNDGKAVNGLWHTYPEMAAAGLWTTPSDLARYILEVQQSVQDRSHRVLSKAMTDQMLTDAKGGTGLGPGVRGQADSLIFSHGGANEGFRCLFMAYGQRGDGVVIMTNSDNGMAVIQELARSLSTVYNWEFGKPNRIKKATLTAAQTGLLLGTYTFDKYTLELQHQNGTYLVKPQWEDSTTEIIPQNHRQFIARDGQRLEFLYEGDSKVTAVRLIGGPVFTKVN